MSSRLASLLLCSVLAAGCNKASEPTPSGPLAGDDVKLLHDIPGGNLALFGGNYMKLQNFMQTAAGKFASRVFEKMADKGEGMAKWMQCFTDLKNVKLGGGVAKGDDGLQLRMAFTGMTIKDVAGCADKAGFTNAVDPDGKFISIEVPGIAGQSSKPGYLQLADGALYFRQSFQLGMMPVAIAATRADLEGDAAAAAKSSAADDKKLLDLAAKTDRTRTIWFAGSAKGTPAADKLGDLYGSMDIGDGIAIDIVAQITDSELASTIEKQIGEVKKHADQMPSELRPVVDNLKLDRNGDHLRFVAKISNSQLQSIMKLSGGMGL